jgi:hypothetical protein
MDKEEEPAIELDLEPGRVYRIDRVDEIKPMKSGTIIIKVAERPEKR